MTLLKKIEEYWTNRAEGYSKVNKEELQGQQRNRWYKEIECQIKQAYPDHRPEELKVLDVGSGPGFFAIILAEAGYLVTAVDYTEEMIEKAKENAGLLKDKITFLQMDGQHLEFEPDQFDIIISRNLTWVLEKPDAAYHSWSSVLKPGGLLLNFDANWYGYLYDEEKKRGYERDRATVKEQGMEDHYIGTDIDAMEEIAKKVPLSRLKRPEWDRSVLERLGMKQINLDDSVWERVWSDVEKINYASTPMFLVKAVKVHE